MADRKPPRIPRARRAVEGERIRLVPFNPNRASELLLYNGFDHVAGSIAFWLHRLSGTACPDCNAVGSLRVDYMGAGITIECDRARLGRCDFQWQDLLLRD